MRSSVLLQCRGRCGELFIPERRAAGLTENRLASRRRSLGVPAGGVRMANINRALEELKKTGYWIYGLDQNGPHDYSKTSYATPTAFVIGGEGRGLHEHTAKRCDFLVRIPMPDTGVASLNASVAAGVVLFEWRRGRSG